jgi:hypothetical protein
MPVISTGDRYAICDTYDDKGYILSADAKLLSIRDDTPMQFVPHTTWELTVVPYDGDVTYVFPEDRALAPCLTHERPGAGNLNLHRERKQCICLSEQIGAPTAATLALKEVAEKLADHKGSSEMRQPYMQHPGWEFDLDFGGCDLMQKSVP